MKYELDLMDARREGKEEGAVEALINSVFSDQQIANKLTNMYSMSHDEALKLDSQKKESAKIFTGSYFLSK